VKVKKNSVFFKMHKALKSSTVLEKYFPNVDFSIHRFTVPPFQASHRT
jgi:hypothetical protein